MTHLHVGCTLIQLALALAQVPHKRTHLDIDSKMLREFSPDAAILFRAGKRLIALELEGWSRCATATAASARPCVRVLLLRVQPQTEGRSGA
jgi:hypothetical protein